MALQSLPNQHIKDIFLARGQARSCTAGQLLLEKGEPVTRVGFITEGHARTFVTNAQGDEVTLFYLGPDNIIGSEAFTSLTTVRVNVEAISPVTLYTMAPEEFLQTWQAQGLPLQDLLGQFVSRIMMLSDYICCAHLKENHKRIAYFLHSEFDRSGDSLPYSNEQIAAITGINRVSVNRILNQFSREGAIALEYRRIRILDAEKLLAVFGTLGYFLD